MSRPKVLVTAPRAAICIETYQDKLGAAGYDVVVRIPTERLEETDLLPIVGEIEGIVCGDDQITKRVLDRAPRLKVIAKWGTGIDSIDLSAAENKGIQVLNTPGAFTDPVADTVLGYILLFARKLDRMDRDMHLGNWERRSLVSLKELTLGIIGMGDIGCAVAKRANAFDMKILGFVGNTTPKADLSDVNIDLVELDKLLSESDFITLHLDLRQENFNFVDKSRLALMKQTSVLINTARGGLVDEAALIEALRGGGISGAALDVFKHEPLPSNSPLRNMPNVYLSPHNANASPSAAERVHKNSIDNVIKVLGVRN